MRFRITLHSGFAAPADALDLLLQQLGTDRDDVLFAKVGTEIRVIWKEEVPISMECDEREEIGRLVVLNVVCDVCERTPQLKSDWFAVSPFR